MPGKLRLSVGKIHNPEVHRWWKVLCLAVSFFHPFSSPLTIYFLLLINHNGHSNKCVLPERPFSSSEAIRSTWSRRVRKEADRPTWFQPAWCRPAGSRFLFPSNNLALGQGEGFEAGLRGGLDQWSIGLELASAVFIWHTGSVPQGCLPRVLGICTSVSFHSTGVQGDGRLLLELLAQEVPKVWGTRITDIYNWENP